jgi:hypothetical protein
MQKILDLYRTKQSHLYQSTAVVHPSAIVHPLPSTTVHYSNKQMVVAARARVRLVLKIFHLKTSHRILRHMYKALNINKTKKLIIQFTVKSRDESFKSY